MIWLNGFFDPRHDIQYYECKHCNIQVVKYPDDQIIEVKQRRGQSKLNIIYKDSDF